MSETNGREQDANVRERWLSVQATSEYLQLSPRTIQKQAAAGKLTSRRDGRRLLICVPIREQDANDANNSRTMEMALVEQLRSEIAFLRTELAAQREAHSLEIARRDEDIARRSQAEADLRQIAATAQQAALVANRELSALRAIAPAPQEAIQEAGQDGQSVVKASWWARLLGRNGKKERG